MSTIIGTTSEMTSETTLLATPLMMVAAIAPRFSSWVALEDASCPTGAAAAAARNGASAVMYFIAVAVKVYGDVETNGNASQLL